MVSRFTSIDIEGLFGDRNETIDFPDLDDPIRILYGVNGSGKTTILKIIQNTYRWNPLELIKLPFNSISFNKNTRRKFSKETYFDGLVYYVADGNRNLSEEDGSRLIAEWTTSWESKTSDELFEHLKNEAQKLEDKWHKNREKWSIASKKLLELNQTTLFDFHHPTDYHDIREEKRKQMRDTMIILEEETPKIRSQSVKLMVEVGIFFKKKLHELNELDDEKSPLSYHHWGDGVSLSFDPPHSREEGIYSVEDLDIRINREFDYNTSLKVEKIENPSQIFASFDLDKIIYKDVGCLLKITEKHKPRLEFKDKQIETTLKLLDKINKISPHYNYKFAEMFEGIDSTYIIRMPDLYDYWDLDWERIEQKLTGYEIKRSVTGKNIHDSNLEKDFEIRKPKLGKINVHDFLRYHLSYELITHAKEREVKDFTIDKHYSKRNRPPSSIVDFFEYDKTAISFDNHGNPDSEYVHLPRVVDISTEREVGAEYFWQVKRYVNNEIRVLLRSISDFKDKKLEQYKQLNSSHIEMVQTRLKERGIDLDKFRERPIVSKKGRGTRYDANILENEIIKCISNAKKQSEAEKYSSRMDYLFSDLTPKTDPARDNDYTVDGLNLRPLVSVIEELVSLSEIELFVGMIASRFDGIKINIHTGTIKSGRDKISFNDLSSGERQKFLIFTNIGMQISNTSSSILMTIDEPEISLHLSWQRQFVDDVIEFIGELTSKYRVRFNEDDDLDQIVSLIISTHSPTLLANHLHRGQKLGEDDIDG
tara:strand:- start:2025 stop:4313 length:2289 start_codon:yes stop_codon:yes gene_type:complete